MFLVVGVVFYNLFDWIVGWRFGEGGMCFWLVRDVDFGGFGWIS